MDTFDEVIDEIKAVISRYADKSISDAPDIAIETQPLLRQIADEYGAASEEARSASMIVANWLFSVGVDESNSALRQLKEQMSVQPQTRADHLNAYVLRLESALAVMVYVGKLPLDESFRNQTLAPQIERLQMLIDKAKQAAQQGVDVSARSHETAAPQSVSANAAILSTAGRQKSQRRWGKGIAVALVVAIVGLCAYSSLVLYRQRKALADIRQNYTEEAIMAYLIDNGDSPNIQEALTLYLDKMDSLLLNDMVMKQPSQYPPLVRMDNFARNQALNPMISRMINSRVLERTDSLYKIALSANTTEAWDSFQAMAPSRYYRDSSKRLDVLEAQAWGKESTAWQAALHADMKDTYERYLAIYPDGAHAADAQGKLIDIEVNAYKNRGKAAVERIDSIASQPGNIADIHVFNETAYDMEFLFSGPSSRKMTVKSEGVNTIELLKGNYRILVIIGNKRSDRFSFSQTFYGGVYSTAISVAE